MKTGLEIERSNTLERAKEAVARCSIAEMRHVTISKLGTSKKCVGEIVENAHSLNRNYNFVLYNCRHFVLDLLKLII